MARSGKSKVIPTEEVEEVKPSKMSIALSPILLIYFGLAIAYNLFVPGGTVDQHNADENAHVLYVQTLANGHLPVFQAGANAYENHQPPLYYLLCLPVLLVYKAIGGQDPTHALRLVSTMLGILLIYAAYKTTETLFPAKPVLSLSVAAFIALLPMNVNINASVTNDALTNVIIALGLWQAAKITTQPAEKQSDKWLLSQAMIYGLILGAGILTKTSTLLLFPIALLTYTLAARRGLMSVKLAFRGSVITLFLGLLIGAPWLLRNQMLYGDPVAQHIFMSAFVNTAQAPDIIRAIFHGDIFAYFGAVINWTYASYWGVFDSMRLFWGQDPKGFTPPPGAPLSPIYCGILPVIAISVAGLLWLLIKKPTYITPAAGVSLSSFVTLIFLTAVVFLRFILQYFQAQGRYIYPSLVPLTILFWLGLFAWTDRPVAQRLISAVVIIGLLLLNVYSIWSLIMPRFAGAGLGQV